MNKNFHPKALVDNGAIVGERTTVWALPPHVQSSYTDMSLEAGDLPIAERLANEILSLPIGPHIKTDQQNQAASEVMRLASSAL